MLSPLDQLYLETTSKEDLLAEINDQRRQVIEARGLAAELERKLLETEKERDVATDENKILLTRLTSANNRLAKMYKKHGKPQTAGGLMKSKIAQLIGSGLDNAAISGTGFNPSTVRAVRSRLGITKEKAAQSI